ncbi:helix-turn-helix domain-containing protein [Nocardia sp. 2]|uniref:Helix-turn-helix domain-containing protein n=1 Tax=Nocardia acididurans TaxID=2802282 RepID=A0ABS1M4D3_9NOCA|nr:helix-turn-helix domain-containing protein [Nocardia acididurans]MBL1075391.1 helix-turn-helix domain-containing protein [Nocardia acididurans]
MNVEPPPPDGFAARACRMLLDRLDDLVRRVSAEIQRAEPAYGVGGIVGLAELRKANRDNLVALLEYLAAGGDPGTDAPYATGRRRAEGGIPLPAVLRAYRIGSAVVWEELVGLARTPEEQHELLILATRVWKLVDDYSQALTIGYQEAVAEHSRRDARAQDAALDALLSGRADGTRLWDCARALRLPPQGSYAVVAAAAGATAEEAIPGIAEALAVLGVRSAWRVQLDQHVGLVALTERFTVERLCDILAERTVGRVGISAPFGALTETPAALRQAESTCAAADPDSRQVLHYNEALIPVLLATAPDIAAALTATVLGPILALPEHDRITLLDTARGWFAHGGEVAAVAESLFCHRNTVRFRINRIAELTGRRLSSPAEAVELYLALRAYRVSAPPAGPGVQE